MSNEAIFKFVSLRAPVPADPGAEDPRTPIPAPDESTSPLEEMVDGTGEDLPFRDRLRNGSDAFIEQGLYFFHRLDGAPRTWLADVGSLVRDTAVTADGFKNRADALLEQISSPNDNFTDGWRHFSLVSQVWSSYCATLFASRDRGRESRALLQVIRLIYGFERASEPGFSAAELGLGSRRAAIPARLTGADPMGAAGSHLSSGRNVPRPVSVPSSATTDSRGQAAKDVRELVEALRVVKAAIRARKKRLVEATHRALADEVEQPRTNASDGGRQKAKSAKFVDLTHVVKGAGSTKLHELTDEDISDAAVRETLQRFRLDVNGNALELMSALNELVASKMTEAAHDGQREVIAWEKGAFVRVRRKVRQFKQE